MKSRTGEAARLAVAAALIALTLPSVAAPASTPVRSIVILEHGAADAPAMQRIERLGGKRVKELPLVGGAVVLLPSTAAEQAVKRIDGVRLVERDAVAHVLAKPVRTPLAQQVPWGIARIGAQSVWATYTGDPVKVAVVDTGVNTTHPDLAANVKGGVSAVGYTTSYADDNGHGSHVAGTIAAASNTIGVVGVAPAADVYGIKVLDRRGSGYVSDIIEGLDWAIANDMDVVNMSLGTSVYVSSFQLAVRRVSDAGIVVVAAAGNNGIGLDTVTYPAKFPGVIGVSAVNDQNVIASFSSRGPAVDIAAPGVGVYSTALKSSYVTMSGTSMASPHVAGAAALVLTAPVAGDDLDGDGAWDPAEVEARLERSAHDLGTAGVDTDYGAGLVRVDVALAAQ